ncbi:MAG: hypothetical protein MAG453_00713 [Calditrichaeota bacterium]|nr:hypothetical protein [Calditrichota bacterium]
MQGWLDFARGPLFRFCFLLMVLGLLRAFAFSAAGLLRAHRRAGDRDVPWRRLVADTVSWLAPVGRLWRSRPLYSTISVVWHAGLILVPLFLAAHVTLFRNSAGFAWFALPQPAADVLTWLTVLGSFALFAGRVGDRNARSLSRRQDYLWPLLIAVPFISGALCSQAPLSPAAYQALMLVHLLSGNLVLVLIPFTKVAHCVLLPLSQLVSGVGWKFPAGAGDRVAATLGKPPTPVVDLKPSAGHEPTHEPVREEMTA